MRMILEEALRKLFILHLLISVLPASSDSDRPMRNIEISQVDTGDVLEFEVVIMNEGERSVCGIHVDCGKFASYKLVDPGVFHRLSPGDCLVLDGGPLEPRREVRFVYMSDRKFPMHRRDATFC
ncbi:hypothetical protein SELMODRAFT_451573 [Selaginella moellendorffii]|uniref:Uncharacterized protein TPD1C2-1 n=1 Tax=Selaginella moellendorffii TaxID=88036 RepID=D8RQE5_SELML|nr:hypothetical protein SELMODRAFT_451573 [Selaginella moellendorffii]